MRTLYRLAFLAVLFGANVESIELRPRQGQDCGLLSNNKIYCYGGYILGNSGVDVLNSLDIYKNDGKPPQYLNSQWEEVTAAPTSIKIGRRGFPQAATAPDGERFLIQGGYNYDAGPIEQQTIAYNVKSNSWESFANYNDLKNGGDRQIYYGSGEYIPSLNQFAYFGGYQQHVVLGSNYTNPDGESISGLTFNNSDNYINSYAGFHYLTLFDLNTNIWTVPPQTNVPKDYQILFSATYHEKSRKIFYIGGSYHNTTSDSLYNAYLTYARTFNTANGEWLRESIKGTAPTQREQHTTTLLPNGDDILLYGGTLSEAVAVMDYCYTLNVPTLTWKYHNLVAPPGVSGPRSHHSAVLVNKTSLFILFGLNKDATPTNELLILDVRNVDDLKFAATFPFDGGVDTTGNNQTSGGVTDGATSDEHTSSDDDHKEGLSKGAIAGIAVGGVIAGALLVLALVYYSRSKKSRQGANVSGNSTHYEQQRNADGELLEVDWDKIDDHYKEVSVPPVSASPAPHHQYYTQQRHLTEDIYSDTNSSAGISTMQLPDVSTTSSPETRAVGLSPNFAEAKPNSPDTPVTPIMMKVVKPDGGN